jgi:hypothetical protein
LSDVIARVEPTAVDAFLDQLRAELPPKPRGRLILAIDATASREPAWDRACHIQGALFEAGHDPPASKHIPAAARVVDIEMWRRYHYAGTASDGQTAEARKKAFQRSRQQLHAHRIIQIHTDLCWIVDCV